MKSLFSTRQKSLHSARFMFRRLRPGRRSRYHRAPVFESARRPVVGALVLASFLTTQCIFPLGVAYAQATAAPQPRFKNAAPPLRLAQRDGDGGRKTSAAAEETAIGEPDASASLRRRNQPVSFRKLDVSHVPTEKELREAGGMGGAMSPIGNADVTVFTAEVNKELKQSGFARGLSEQAAPNSAPGKVLTQARTRVERLKEINLSFGQALDQRVKRNFDRTRELMKQHLEDFPDSPWAGEAILHLAMDAQSHGQPGAVQALYEQLLDGTEVDPAHPDMDPDNPQHGAYDVRQKAKAGWANLDISLGQWDSAEEKLKNIVDTEVDWRRRGWAQSWQMQIRLLRGQKKQMQACGTAALGAVMVSLGRKQAGAQVQKMTPPRSEGFSLAELANISRKHGLEARGFQATSAQLAAMPLPVIIHYDMSRLAAAQKVAAEKPRDQIAAKAIGSTPNVKSGAGSTQAGSTPGARALAGGIAAGEPKCEMCPPAGVATQEPLVCVPATQTGAQNKATQKVAQKVFINGKPVLNPAAKRADSARSVFRPAAIGHFLVVEKADSKTKSVQLFDPLENKRYRLSFDQLEKEWSGYGLAFSSPKAAGQRSASLSGITLGNEKMAHIFGGCCCFLSSPGNNGPGAENMGPGESPCGAPVWAVNRISMNTFVQDVPLWYSTPVGPDVSIGMYYNTQSPVNYNQAFGNRWQFAYSSHIMENPDGTVAVLMPDSRELAYFPKAGGGYRSPVEQPSTLQKLSANRFQLFFPTGDSFIYDLPNGDPLLIGAGPVLSEIRDNRGNALVFGFDNDGRMTTITDAQSKQTQIFYEDSAHPYSITLIKDPFGRQAHFEYNAGGNLVQVWDMEGAGANYTYDANIWMTQMETARGSWNFTHAMVYQGVQLYSRQVTITDPTNQTEQFYWGGYHTYDGRFVTYTDKRGQNTRYAAEQMVGNSGKLTWIIAPDNSETHLTYDPWTAQPATITDAKGRTTRMTYNALGKLATVTDAKGRTTRLDYDANGVDLLGVFNSRGQKVMSAAYNAYHQPESVTQDPNNIAGLQATSTVDYTAWGAPSSASDAGGNDTTFTYDATSKRLTSVAREGATLGSFTYDRMGRIATVTDALSLTTTYDYNDLNRLERVTYPDGTYSEQDSSCCGIAGAVRDRAGRLSYTDYDAMKRPVRMQDAAGNVVSLEYDGEGNLTHIIDAKGNVTSFAYDGLGRLVRKSYPNHSTESFAYDAVGNLLASRDAQGRLTRYFYDGLTDDLLKVDHPVSADVSFNYDDLGRVTAMTDGVGTSSYSYDLLNRATAIDGPFANDTLSFAYDALGRRQSYALNGTAQAAYSFDAQGRLDSLTGVAGVFDYDYVGNSGLLSQLTMPSGAKSVYGYDAMARLNQVSNKTSANANLSTFAYGFDLANTPQRDVRTMVDKTIGSAPTQRSSFGYDGVDQLTGEVLSEGATTLLSKSFAYDAMGNRSDSGTVSATDTATATYTSNRLNQLTALNVSWNGGASTSASSLLYDASGNLRQWSASGTGSAASSHTEYFYDDADRLIAVIKKNPATSANEAKTEFVYDGLSRLRVSREYSWSGGAWVLTPNSEKRRVYDGLDVIQERDAANVAMATFTRDGNIGGILSKRDALGVDTFFHYDGSGNVVGLSDSSQASVAEYSYDAYGNVMSSSGAQSASNAYRYSTKEYFASVGLTNYGYRFYSAGLGRWINRDPLGEAGGLNLYGAFGNSPTHYLDQYGLCLTTGQILGIAALGAAAFIAAPALAPALILMGGAAIGLALGYGNAQQGGKSYTTGDAIQDAAGGGLAAGLGYQVAGVAAAGIAALATRINGGEKQPYGYNPTPYSPVGKKGVELNMPGLGEKVPLNSPTTIYGRDYSGHAIDRMQGRGLYPSLIEDTISTGASSPGKFVGTTVYYSPANNHTVVLDSATGRVITTMLGGGS